MKKTPPTPVKPVPKLVSLYETDEVAWLEKSARLIRQKKMRDLDYRHLAEYLSDMAKRDRREVKSRLVTLIVHLLKWEHQPNMRTGSWQATILHQRMELQDILSSKTLHNHAIAILADAYAGAVKVAATETGMPLEKLTNQDLYSLDFLLSDQFPGTSKDA